MKLFKSLKGLRLGQAIYIAIFYTLDTNERINIDEGNKAIVDKLFNIEDEELIKLIKKL